MMPVPDGVLRALAKIRPLAEIEKAEILRAVTAARGRNTLAAKALGIGRATLQRRLAVYRFSSRAVLNAWLALPRQRRQEQAAAKRARQDAILERQERALSALAATGGFDERPSRGRLTDGMVLRA